MIGGFQKHLHWGDTESAYVCLLVAYKKGHTRARNNINLISDTHEISKHCLSLELVSHSQAIKMELPFRR